MPLTLRSYLSSEEILRVLIFLGGLAFACIMPRFADRIFGRIEELGSRFAERKVLAVVSLAIAAVVIRLSLLWLIPVPFPRIHDEFSYLLAADTFAHGRLSNAAHPMWMFLDTIHVNQHPTYMSKYPPAQGMALAFGQLVGNPWFGVLLSTAAMCAVVLWMLQGWFPPRWALLGGVLVLLRLGVFSYWMNSYWGGSVAALGGALVMGALPRLIRHWRARDSVILGLGATILANSRPFEGVILCVPVLVFLVLKLLGRRRPSLNVILPRVVLPLCGIAVIGGLFLGYYNWRGTGNALIAPYMVNEKTYFTTPPFSWQTPKPALHYANPQFDAFYNVYCRQIWSARRITSVASAAHVTFNTVWESVRFFLWPELCLPMLALPWVLRDRRVRFFSIQAAICLSALLLASWFAPHYLGPLTATGLALVLQSVRHMRVWNLHGRPVGIGLSRMVVVLVAILAPFNKIGGQSPMDKLDNIAWRVRFIDQLKHIPGNHLVIVHYAPEHYVLREWVYNAADIDHEKVVWAREIPGVNMQPLFDYFRSRQVWLIDPDSQPPRLTPYVPASQ